MRGILLRAISTQPWRVLRDSFALFTSNVRFLYISHKAAQSVIVNPSENKVIMWFRHDLRLASYLLVMSLGHATAKGGGLRWPKSGAGKRCWVLAIIRSSF